MTTVTIPPNTRLYPLDDHGAPQWDRAMTDVDGSEDVPVVGEYDLGLAAALAVTETRYVLMRFHDSEEYAVPAEVLL